MAYVLSKEQAKCRIPKCPDTPIGVIGYWDHSRDEMRWELSCNVHTPWGSGNVQLIFLAFVELRSQEP